MSNTQALGKECSACGAVRKNWNLIYDPQTLRAYCQNPYSCNEAHPNSPVNLIRNQKEALLVSLEEANKVHKAQLMAQFDAGIVDRIKSMTTKPQTFRIQDPDQAKFIIELQEKMGFESTAEVYRYVIEMMMESKGLYYSDKKKLAKEYEIQQAAQEAVDTFSAEPQTAAMKKDDEELSF
jgi:hypothetical protein